MTRPAGRRGAGGGEELFLLAERAGLQERWVDVHGASHRVSPDTLRVLLDSMGFPCGTAANIRASLAAMKCRAGPGMPKLLIGRAGEPLRLSGLPPCPCLLEHEEGCVPPQN